MNEFANQQSLNMGSNCNHPDCWDFKARRLIMRAFPKETTKFNRIHRKVRMLVGILQSSYYQSEQSAKRLIYERMRELFEQAFQYERETTPAQLLSNLDILVDYPGDGSDGEEDADYVPPPPKQKRRRTTETEKLLTLNNAINYK